MLERMKGIAFAALSATNRDRGRQMDMRADLARDVLRAFRSMRRSPGFAAAAVLTLALGIGANTAIFSLIYALLLRSLPVAHPEELRFIHAHTKNGTASFAVA